VIGALPVAPAGRAERGSMAVRYRELIDAFLEEVARDPAFRLRLREDPQDAIVRSGFARKIEELQSEVWGSTEVMGFGWEDTCFNQWSCLSNSCYVTI
jgi:hypothetical protein